MLFQRPQYFPKQLFRKFVLQQVLGVVPALLLAALLTRIYLAESLRTADTAAAVAAVYDRAFLFLALVMALAVTGISLWTGYRFVLPLGRILVKARSIMRREYATPPREETIDADEEGEWSDLESALHRINRDLQNKDRTLNREREEIEVILAAIPEAIVAVDRLGNLLFFNSRFALLFGGRQGTDQRLSAFVRSTDVLETFRGALRSGETLLAESILRTKTEVGPRHFSIRVSPLKSEGGQVYGSVGVFHDVTELKRMDQVRIDFVANVSHELRTPLTSIKGYTQTLRGELAEGSSGRRFLDTIERNTDRLISLVQDLLSLSSLESGGDLEQTSVGLEALTRRVALQLEPLRAEKRHQVRIEVTVPTLRADEKRLEQVIYNLLENAIKYVPPLGKIDINWEPSPEGGIQLRVRDDGPGIPEEHHGRVFERFYRVDGARTREQGGTGLGLAIVKHIVQRHGGSVKLRGAPGGGSEFVCTFPSEA